MDAQLAPEFVELKTDPGEQGPHVLRPNADATKRLPSAEQAMELQFVRGACVSVQGWAKASLAETNRPPATATAGSRRFAFISWNPDYLAFLSVSWAEVNRPSRAFLPRKPTGRKPENRAAPIKPSPTTAQWALPNLLA